MRVKLILALVLAVLAVLVVGWLVWSDASDSSWEKTCPNVAAPDCVIQFDGK